MQAFHHQNMLICQLTTVVSLFLLVLLFRGTFVGDDFHFFLCNSLHAVLLRPFHAALEDELQKKARNLHDGLKRVVGESDVGIKSFGRILDRVKIDLAVRNSNRIGFNEIAAPEIFGIAITPNWSVRDRS